MVKTFFISLIMATPCLAQVGTPASRPTRQAPQEIEEAKKAQKEVETKALALLDELIAESASLTLVENRVFVQAKAVEMLWKHDEARARALLIEVINQIIALNVAPWQGNEDNNQLRHHRQSTIANLRLHLVNFLATRDASLALEFLRATRPPQPPNPRYGGGGYDEKNLESMIAARVAENDPQLALQMAEEILKTGFNHQLIELLNVVLRKDPQLGARLQRDIIAKLKSLDLLSNYDNINAAFQLMYNLRSQADRAANAQKELRGSSISTQATSAEAAQAYRALLDQMVGVAVKITPADMVNRQEADKARSLLIQLKSQLPEIEKQLPSRAESLRVKLKQLDNALYDSPVDRHYQEYHQKMQNKSARELIEMAATAPQEVRDQIYQHAINKAMEEGDRETARKIANELVSDPQAGSQMLSSFERHLADRAASEGKFDDARRVLTQPISVEEKALALARWSMAALNNKDDRTARQFLDEARALLGDRVQTRQQLEAQMTIATGYLDLEPDHSFERTGLVVERLNRVVAAALEMSVFNGMAEGEKPIGTGEFLSMFSGNFTNVTVELMRRDFDRAGRLLKGIEITEARMMASCNVLQLLLSGQRTYPGRRRAPTAHLIRPGGQGR